MVSELTVWQEGDGTWSMQWSTWDGQPDSAHVWKECDGLTIQGMQDLAVQVLDIQH